MRRGKVWKKKMRPQPPEESVFAEQIEFTDGFDFKSKSGEFLACIFSRIPEVHAEKINDDWYWVEN